MGIDDTLKQNVVSLAVGGFYEEILVSRKEHAPQLRRSVQQG
jgi:hypothetical protein